MSSRFRGAALLVALTVALPATGAARRHRLTVTPCPPRHAVAVLPTPVLNTPDYPRVFGGRCGYRLKLCPVGLVREAEVVALPGAPFVIDGECRRRGRTIYRVTTPDYPYPSSKGYFVDEGFVRLVDDPPPPRPRRLRHPIFIRYKLRSAVGATYLWGGNVRQGIPPMFDFYPPSRPVFGYSRLGWLFRGVDCSGLIYEATDGVTPRNASSLIRFGTAVPIAGCTPEQIVERVEPLDILGWRTHVMIFLDRDHIIQSRVDYDYDTPGNQGGVRIQQSVDYLCGLMKTYTPVDDYDDEVPEGRNKFVIRRWFGQEAERW